MSETLSCNICSLPGTYESAKESLKVHAQLEKFKNEIFTVWRCTNCKSIHSKELPDLDLYYQHYPLKQHKLNFFTRLAYKNLKKQLLSAGLTKKDKILDYGCGKGLLVQYLRECGYNAFGYDPYVTEFSDQSVLADKYDFITNMDVIEHVETPGKTIEQISALLKPLGKLVISTPNADGIKLENNEYPDVELSQPYHRHIFSEHALENLMKTHGFKTHMISRRFYFDTLFPFVNTQFMWTYMNLKGGVLDVLIKPLDFKFIYTKPSLIFKAYLGYFFPTKKNILFVFSKIASQ